MANTTHVPDIIYTSTGVVFPRENEVLTGVQSDFNDALGGNLSSNLETPQGQLASSQTAAIAHRNAFWAYLINGMNPDLNDGVMQDGIARIYFLDRKPATYTATQCDCMGVQGTIIPVGAQAIDTSSNIYLCQEQGIIPITGTITLPFSCITSGPIACPANTLTTIYRAIPGWDRINNSANGVPGSLVESRYDFAFRRQNSVAKNSHGPLDAIYSEVFNLPDVTDVYRYENVSHETIYVGPTNYALLPHSYYIAVAGGNSVDIINAIWLKKDIGCNYNGNVTMTVQDQEVSYPYPEYKIAYNIPASVPILFSISIINDPLMPSNIVDLIKKAIIDAFSGADGGQRARIGSTIFASRYYAPVAATYQNINIISIFVGINIASSTSVALGIDQAPTVSESNIQVTLL